MKPYRKTILKLILALCLSGGVIAPVFGAPVSEQSNPERFSHVFKPEIINQGSVKDSGQAEGFSVHWDALNLEGDISSKAVLISGIAYLSKCDCDFEKRPIMFLFNGGPGASSSPLHFALGPFLREKQTSGPTQFSPNSQTLVDLTDMVFIDPVETGLSWVEGEEPADKYLGVEADAKAVSEFIKAWLVEHDRVNAPVFIAGQSYGGFRLARLLPFVDGVDVRGLFMVSPSLDAGLSTTDQAFVFAIPTMTATAWRFGKGDIQAETETEAFELGRDFAETEYLLALQAGENLPPSRQDEISAQLASLTGLKVDDIKSFALRIPRQYFLENLLADENKVVSRLNTAVTNIKKTPETDRPAAANDPSLGLGRSNKIMSADIARFLNNMTGVDASKGYRSLNLDANFQWNWSQGEGYHASLTAIPPLKAFLDKNVHTRLTVFGGLRDLAIPSLETDYVLSHADLPMDRLQYIPMLGGHSPYLTDESLAAFSQKIRQEILSGLESETKR